MADNILHNILARLPRKPLLRCKCVSKQWNTLISNPYFMKSRARRMILLPILPLHALEDTVPVDDTSHSIVKLRPPFENQNIDKEVTIIGTFKGIVLLVLKDYESISMVLYNPFNGLTRIIPFPPRSLDDVYLSKYVYGFGYGADPNDLKIIMFNSCYFTCDVFSLKTSSWSMTNLFCDAYVTIPDDVGTFVKGFFYWVGHNYIEEMVVVALDIEKMVISVIPFPAGCNYRYNLLGTLCGCLCLVTRSNNGTKIDVSVMKEQGIENLWLKECSFAFGLEDDYLSKFHPTSILDDGRILMSNDTHRLIIYNTSKNSWKMWKVLERFEDSMSVPCIEYVESMVSPYNMCSVYNTL